MSLIDELRIDRKPADPTTLKAEYRIRSRRQVWILVLLVGLLLAGVLLGEYRPSSLEPVWVRVLAIAAMLGCFGLHYWNWRCPSCAMFFGKRQVKSRCPGCGVTLED